MTKYDLRAMSRATQSMRSGYRPLYDDEMVGITKDEHRYSNEQNKSEMETLEGLASLNNHSGYQQIRKMRLETIRQYRSGEFLLNAAVDPDITNTELGELTRVGLIVAETLERELATVESAVSAVNEEKERERQDEHATRTNRQKPKGA